MPLDKFPRYAPGHLTLRLNRRRSCWLRIAWLASLVASGLHGSSALAQTADDWNECLRASDADERAEACTEIIGETRDPRSLVRALTGRGNALCASADRCREAVPDFTSVVKLAPKVPGYADNLARALRAAGRYDEALRASDRAIELAPRMIFTYSGKAMTLDAAGRAADALGVIDAAIALAPGEAGLWEYKGKLLGELKRYGEAYTAFDRAISLQPQRAKVYVRRADVEMAEGRIDDAIGDLGRYPATGADADLVRGELNALRAVRDRLSVRPQAEELHSEAAATCVANQTLPAAKPTCNLHDWMPVEECISQYHNQNDPLPSGAPNPKRWNKELAAEGQALAARHPDVKWDRSEWNTIVAKDAEETASEQAEIQYHKEQRPAASEPDQAKQTNDAQGDARPGDKPNGSSEIARCDAPEVLSVIRRLSEEGVKKQVFRLLMANIMNAKFELTGIRQVDYDPTSEHRFCAMDRKMLVTYYAGTKMPPGRLSVPIKYEIERQLDGDHGSYVTCKCD